MSPLAIDIATLAMLAITIAVNFWMIFRHLKGPR